MKQALTLAVVLLAGQAAVGQELAITTATLPWVRVGQPYRVELQARGGRPPYRWRVSEGTLPTGFSLSENGVISGRTARGGKFQLVLQVSDSDTPPQTVLRKFGLEVAALIEVTWITPPHMENGGIYGSVRVTNGSNRDFDLTVVVVAVNEIHKAFALGHRHFVLRSRSTSAEIPFGFTLPRGIYGVRADAVGEVAATNQIFRAFAESGGGVEVP